MTAQEDDLEALRTALYRQGASASDRSRYAAALARRPVPATEDPPAVVRRRRRWPRAVAGAAVAAAVLAAASIAAVSRLSAPPYPTVASTPIALLGAPARRARAQADLAQLFDERGPFLGLYLARHRTALSASLRSDSIAVDGHGTGPTTVSLAGITTPGQPTGLMTVLLACDRKAAYSWVLTGPDDSHGRPVRTGASGADCGGGVVTATFVPRPNHVPTRIRVIVPEDVRMVVEVDLSRY